MTSPTGKARIDTASRVIRASPDILYQAFVNPEDLVSWLPPKGMKGEICLFEPRKGGRYRMALTYVEGGHATPGKSSDDTDVVQGTFLELVKDRRIVQLFEFESDDPAFAGAMTMTWTFAPVREGTMVTIICENVPDGIRPEDHDEGLNSTLDNLAAFAE